MRKGYNRENTVVDVIDKFLSVFAAYTLIRVLISRMDSIFLIAVALLYNFVILLQLL